MPEQRCPACGFLHDVSIFTSGTRVKCYTCKLPFVVQRPDSVIADPGMLPAVKPKGDSLPMAPPSDSDTQAGEARELVIDGYQLFEILGKGGMGRVHRAKQVSLNRAVAIKVLNDDLAKHRSFIRRFEKESGALASLNSPNITSIFDRGHVEQTYYFVMEYVAGPSLRHLINRGKMEIFEIIQHVVVLCGAMGHAHKRSVIHRDLKPENVLFTEDGVLKVADFGLANIVAPDRRWELTRTQVSMGTVNYMAPEQRQDAKHVDHRADIYSLGVMFYEMLARELPLGRFQPPSNRCEGLDSRVDDLVLRMLDVDPDRRPQESELIAAQLESLFGRIPRAAVHAVPQAAGAQKAKQPLVVDEPPKEEAVSTLVSKEPALAKEKPPGKRLRIPRLVVLLVGGLTLLVLAAVGVATLLWFSSLGNTPGDLDLHKTENGIQMNVTHPWRVKYLSPTSVRDESSRKVFHFDFLPSTLPVVSVAFIGGSWETERGRLVQDSCRTGLVINQVPARALFGQEEVSPEGVEIEVRLEARPATYRVGGEDDREKVTVEEYLKKNLGGIRSLVPVDIDVLVGLGFLDKESRGLEIRLPLSNNGPGELIRTGKMEGEDKTFPLKMNENFFDEVVTLKMSIYQGRVRLIVGERLVVDELAGFPLGFKGHPSIACQNAQCGFKSVEYILP
jgi:serine/threonine protein kinase